MSRYSIILCFLVIPFFLAAQVEDTLDLPEEKVTPKSKKTRAKETRLQLAQKRIGQLKEGILIVRLKTQHLKISALEKLAKEASVSKQATYQAQLKQTLFERDSLNQEIVKYFSDPEYFDFCKVYFMYDTETEQYSQNIQQGYFLNSALEVDPSISLEGKYSLMTYIGQYMVDGDKRTAYTSFITKDKHMGTLSPPFPSHVVFRSRQEGLSKKNKMRYAFVDLPISLAVKKLNTVFTTFISKE